MEEWKDIPGYEGLYQVSNLGNIRSLNYKKTGKVKRLKVSVTKKGYKQLQLCKNGERNRYLVHRLVAEAFIPNPNNLPQVNHKDENKGNNRVENLEWCTQKYNTNYGTCIQRIVDTDKHNKKVICIETQVVYNSQKEASEKTGINHGNICMCCKGKLKSAGGYTWCYTN